MFLIDEKIDYPRLQQFASQVSNLSKRLSSELEANYTGDQTDEFYQGLLAGFANSLSVFQNVELSEEDKQSLLGALVAFVSDRIARRGL
ncbi:MAG: hypothetical protein VX768_16865 [Planctomycetota bacterium]|nr:hypothetical protein [Planctomycetota bacterium]